MIRPVIFRITWWSSFDKPSSTGYVSIKRGAYVRGGHEVVAVGIDVSAKRVWFYNSWGASWGLKGRFCLSWATLTRLLSEQGDCTVPIP